MPLLSFVPRGGRGDLPLLHSHGVGRRQKREEGGGGDTTVGDLVDISPGVEFQNENL